MPTVSITDTNKNFEVEEGSILYNSLSDQGEELPHGCLSGSCGACRIVVHEGKDNLNPPSVIELNTIDALKNEFRKTKGEDFVNNCEIRLSCRARVTGNISIKPIE